MTIFWDVPAPHLDWTGVIIAGQAAICTRFLATVCVFICTMMRFHVQKRVDKHLWHLIESSFSGGTFQNIAIKALVQNLALRSWMSDYVQCCLDLIKIRLFVKSTWFYVLCDVICEKPVVWNKPRPSRAAVFTSLSKKKIVENAQGAIKMFAIDVMSDK